MLVRVWEMQKRGLLHAHPVFAYSTLSEKVAADRYVEHLDELRHRWGFGYVERKRRVREPRAAAAYLSSYFVNGKGSKASLEESVRSEAMPRSIIHTSVVLTQRSGVTMRTLRLRRYAWKLWRSLPSSLLLATCLDVNEIHYGLREGLSWTEIVSAYL